MKNETEEPELEDMLTELDPLYESKEELKIGRMLDQYGIPFFYRQATIIYDQGKNEVWKPSSSIMYMAQSRARTMSFYEKSRYTGTIKYPRCCWARRI